MGAGSFIYASNSQSVFLVVYTFTFLQPFEECSYSDKKVFSLLLFLYPLLQ